MVKFLFLLCLKENFSRQNKFGERKKLGEHCPRIPPVATGLQVSQHDAKLGWYLRWALFYSKIFLWQQLSWCDVI